jgi:hypothetical protein
MQLDHLLPLVRDMLPQTPWKDNELSRLRLERSAQDVRSDIRNMTMSRARTPSWMSGSGYASKNPRRTPAVSKPHAR